MIHLDGIGRLEVHLWKVSDDLRTNSGLAPNENFMPTMGLRFLRQGANRYDEALTGITADKAAGKILERDLVEADCGRRRAMMLPEAARYDTTLEGPKDGTLGTAPTDAMVAESGGSLGSPGSRRKTANHGEYFPVDCSNLRSSTAGRQAYLPTMSGSFTSDK